MRKYLLSMFFLFSIFGLSAQELDVKPKIGNPSNVINNGFIELDVTGGTPPYQYKWSNQSTSLESNRAEGLTEGVSYDVVVSDSEGNSVEKSYKVDAEAITEHFNGTFAPIVEGMGSVLFWDPFSAIGIYDPVVYADVKRIAAPEWDATESAKFTLKEWLVEEGEHVNEGDPVAIVSKNGQDITAKANAAGSLDHLLGEGEVIYDSENKEDVIEQGAQYFASIKYDEPIALLHPNGDPQTKHIPFIVVWLVLGALFFTLRLGFINIRGFRHSLQLAKGKFDDPNAPGQVTHFQALATAVSGTVGLGNIAGVAVAISLGGAGATMWMILAGLLGMSSKFVECTLGVKYRFINSEGRVFGGPMNYLRYGLEKRNKRGLGKFLAGFFEILAIVASFCGGNMFQA
ncbi:MAG: alanine:cation symporter family protein, partial [Christiangramia sp.]|nr:alanine:cation symporter family protein [Christiangramia sp.]